MSMVQPNLEEYGIFEVQGCYYMLQGNMEIRLTNFMIEPIFVSQIEGERVMHCIISNDKGEKEDIDLAASTIESLHRFRRCTEGCGNFLFYGGNKSYSCLKKWLVRSLEIGFTLPVSYVRAALKKGDVQRIEWLEDHCMFSVRQEPGSKIKYRCFYLDPKDAIQAMMHIGIVPFKFFLEDFYDIEDPRRIPEKGGSL